MIIEYNTSDGNENRKIARVFPRRTSMTPTDELLEVN